MSRPWSEHPEGAVAFCIALEALRMDGASVTVLPDNEEAETRQDQCAVDCVGPWTEWKERRFYGSTPLDAILAAGREQARNR